MTKVDEREFEFLEDLRGMSVQEYVSGLPKEVRDNPRMLAGELTAFIHGFHDTELWQGTGREEREFPDLDKYVGAKQRERLAEYAHDAWSGWMRYLFSKGTFNDDGTWTMPEWAVERWTRQMDTDYHDLPEGEKETDKKEANRIWFNVLQYS